MSSSNVGVPGKVASTYSEVSAPSIFLAVPSSKFLESFIQLTGGKR